MLSISTAAIDLDVISLASYLGMLVLKTVKLLLCNFLSFEGSDDWQALESGRDVGVHRTTSYRK